MPIGGDEMTFRMGLPGQFDHLIREIDPHAKGRFQAGKQVTRTAADLEDAQAGLDEETGDFIQTAVVVSPQAFVFP